MHPPKRPAPNRARFLPWAVAGGLLLAVAIIYGQTLQFGFVDYDDPVFVTSCPEVQAGLTGKGIAWALTSGPGGEWYPLSMLSHMLDCQLFGLDARWHHLTNLLLHAATAIGLFLVLRSMTGELWPSALVAAIFAVHPQHVESVAWIAERRDVLSGLFFVLALAAYAGYVRHGRGLERYLLVALMLALGLMAKSILVTLPALLLLLDYWPLGRFGRAADLPEAAANLPRPGFWRLALEKLPLAAVAVAAAVATMQTHNPQPYYLPWSYRLANAVVSSVAYLGQLLVPVDLSIAYPYPAAWPAWQVAASAVLLVAITAGAVLVRRAFPYLLVGWLWYLVALVPVLGLVLIGVHARADRYTYLSQIGLDLALVWGATRLAAALSLPRRVLAVAAAAVLVALTACSWRQTGFWQSDRALWQHALDCNPDNIYAHYIFAATLEKAGDRDGAADHYRQATERWPDERAVYWIVRAESHNALGNFAESAGDIDQAIAHYQQALDWNPGSLSAHLNLGRLLLTRDQLDAAIAHFRRCIELNRLDPRPHYALAVALVRQNHVADAIAEYRRALDVAPDFAPALRALKALEAANGAATTGQR